MSIGSKTRTYLDAWSIPQMFAVLSLFVGLLSLAFIGALAGASLALAHSVVRIREI
ncbi:MAG: hypothetical protein GY811_01135 [Myxococcales bacterium]|nr:hypothetical protein [Myxococcales bacterium]